MAKKGETDWTTMMAQFGRKEQNGRDGQNCQTDQYGQIGQIDQNGHSGQNGRTVKMAWEARNA